jgi:hypothetical protein
LTTSVASRIRLVWFAPWLTRSGGECSRTHKEEGSGKRQRSFDKLRMTTGGTEFAVDSERYTVGRATTRRTHPCPSVGGESGAEWNEAMAGRGREAAPTIGRGGTTGIRAHRARLQGRKPGKCRGRIRGGCADTMRRSDVAKDRMGWGQPTLHRRGNDKQSGRG